MKKLKTLLLGVIIGLVIGLWFGVNLGKDKPFYSNPFQDKTLQEKAKEKTSEVLQDTKKALQRSLGE